MRISDWSSDVCSSDLRNPNPNPREGHSSLRETPYDIRSWGIENNLKYSGEAVNITSVTAYHSLKATYTGDAGIGDRTGIFLSLRSAEHTSELQSLMRTSYAVY